ncbi:MAG: beta-ketoacyl synthase N-terminal-like domain-containing protein, partial [Desulfobacteraceae bacterium]|nr:beta-ketoacyl synthase N-terminal-like domain-containing protein [Desulfobacteraceae bacterium]
MNPVAIAGVGCICALGATYDSCMQALYKGERNFSLPSRFPVHCETSQPVFEVPDRFLYPWPFPKTLPRTSRMTLIATEQAMAQAHLKQGELARPRVGVCVGTNIGVTAGYEIGQAEADSFLLPRDRFLATNPTSLVATTLDLSGPQQ